MSESSPSTACGRCGANPAAGLATINGVRYCHADDAEWTCYMAGPLADGLTPNYFHRAVTIETDDDPPRMTILAGDDLRRALSGLPGYDRVASAVHWINRATAAEAELAALKARRCDGCKWWHLEEHGWGTCRSHPGMPIGQARMASNQPIITAPDHACNAWQPKEAQP